MLYDIISMRIQADNISGDEIQERRSEWKTTSIEKD
jgi:hypothetical protein